MNTMIWFYSLTFLAFNVLYSPVLGNGRDPCEVSNVCGPNAICIMQASGPSCACYSGMSGKPYTTGCDYPEKLLGAFKDLQDSGYIRIDVGDIYSKGDNQLVIKRFIYHGQAPSGRFYVGTKGKEPSKDGISVPWIIEGSGMTSNTYFAVGPQAFDGSQNDIVLTLPDDIKVKELKWISIWDERYERSYADFIFQDHSDSEDEVPTQKEPHPCNVRGGLRILGDNICDDEANNEACNFDEGDCCLSDEKSLRYCDECECKEPGKQNVGRTRIQDSSDEEPTTGFKDCGKRLSQRDPTGLGQSNGQSVSTLEHAWSVAIMKQNEDSGEDKLHCSGSLISDKHVLTASHCFYTKTGQEIEKYEFTLIFGSTNPADSEENEKRNAITRSRIKELHIHPKYDKKSAYFDIGIVELARPIRYFQENIWPICIPAQPMPNFNHLYDKTGYVVAYGPNGKNAPSELTAIDLPVRSKEWCERLFAVDSLHPKFTVISKSLPNPKKFNDPSIFCAQKEGSNFGTCEGDSGGPFVRFDADPTDPKWYQAAVVHGSGESCDGTRFPSIFVRLDNEDILPWILEIADFK